MNARGDRRRGARAPWLAAMILIATGCRGQSVQWWPEVDLNVTVKKANVFIPSLIRLDSGSSNPQLVATGIVGTIALSQHWSASTGYLFADLPQSLPQNGGVAHVPLFAVTPSFNLGSWKLSDTNRVERLISFSNEPYRYRNRANGDFAFGKGKTKHLYVSNEFFFNLSSGAWNQNRAQLGIGWMLNQRTRFDAYFLERSAPGGNEKPVVGSVLTIVIHHK